MSISNTRKPQEVQRVKMLGTSVQQSLEKTAKIIRQDLFGYLAFFAVVVTGIGSLYSVHFSNYWLGLTALLVLGAFSLETQKQKPFKEK